MLCGKPVRPRSSPPERSFRRRRRGWWTGCYNVRNNNLIPSFMPVISSVITRRTAMNVTLRKIGNSEGVILPKEVLDRHNLRAGDTLVLIEEGEELKLRRSSDDPEEFERKMKIAR